MKRFGMEEIMEYKFTTDNFDNEVLKSDVPVLVDFYADWCGPCKMMVPVVAALAEKYEGKVKVGKCNIDEDDGLARMYRVMSIPTMKIFVKGEVAASIVGAVSQEELESEINKVL
jgi:thioredoxin 1